MIQDGIINAPYLWVDGYNSTIKRDVAGTIMYGYDFRNHWFITTPPNNEITDKRMIAQINLETHECRCFDIRKLTPIECYRLMGVRDNRIAQMMATPISQSSHYKLAGNSIVTDVLQAIFRQVWFNKPTPPPTR